MLSFVLSEKKVALSMVTGLFAQDDHSGTELNQCAHTACSGDPHIVVGISKNYRDYAKRKASLDD